MGCDGNDMTEELVTIMITNLPNFAGFVIALLLMYRVMVRTLELLQQTNEQLRDCLRDTLINHTQSKGS